MALWSTYGFDIAPDAEAVEVGVAVGDVDVARQHLEGGGFAGAVDAQQAETLAATDAQTEAIHRPESRVVVFHQIPTIN